MKKLLIFIFITCLTLLFYDDVFRGLVKYEKVEKTASYPVLKEHLISKIEFYDDDQPKNVHEILLLALDITSEEVSFTTKKALSKPDDIIVTNKANCVGYSKMLSSVTNYLLIKYKHDLYWEMNNYTGQLYFAGMNVHHYLNDPFLKGHDFNVLVNKETGRELAFDASLYDYTDINHVTLKNN